MDKEVMDKEVIDRDPDAFYVYYTGDKITSIKMIWKKRLYATDNILEGGWVTNFKIKTKKNIHSLLCDQMYKSFSKINFEHLTIRENGDILDIEINNQHLFNLAKMDAYETRPERKELEYIPIQYLGIW